MAWNPHPKVADCREIARKWGKRQVIIVGIDEIAGTLEVATYGNSRTQCADARHLGDIAYEAIARAWKEKRDD